MLEENTRTLAQAIAAAIATAIAPFGDLPAQHDPRVTWLGEHAVKVASIDPLHDSFDDLRPLAAALDDARVVQLGEQSHGDGAVLLAKTRLVRFLHEELEFDVLAFESGFYDCSVAWRELQQGGDPVEALEYGLFPIWTCSAQMEPLARYLGERAASTRPLELCGFDCQFTGKATRERLLPDLEQLLTAAPGLLPREDAMRLYGLARSMSKHGEFAKRLRARALRALADLVDRLDDDDGLEPRERARWRQLARSWRAYLDYDWQLPKAAMAARIAARDAQMADNLIWLAEQRYPDRKVIVWGATMHLQRNAGTIDTRNPALSYADMDLMGDHVAKALGDDVFTIGFVAHHGRMGLPWSEPREIPAAEHDSFEDLCARADLEHAIVPFRGLADDHWLRTPLVARPLGHSEMRADWTQVVDAFFFHRVTTPSERRAVEATLADAPPRPPQPLLLMLTERWRQVRDAGAHGEPRRDVQRFVPVFDEWCEQALPDRSALDRSELGRIELQLNAWAGVHGREPGFGWRYAELRAHLARHRGEHDRAREALRRAIDDYPADDYGDPEAQGSFHHLVGQLALWMHADRGFDAALDTLASRLENDRRMRLFADTDAWRHALSEPQRARLLERIAAAYTARGERFPEFSAEAERFAKQLR